MSKVSKKLKMVLHIFAHNFLNIQLIFNLKKFLESWDFGLSNHIKSYVCQAETLVFPTILNPMYVKDVEDYIIQHYMESTHYIGAHVEDVKSVKYYEWLIKGSVCQRCWRCEILWIIDQRLYVEGVKDMSNIALYWGVYPLNYTVDPNMKSSNYNKIQLKALNYFELETLWIR